MRMLVGKLLVFALACVPLGSLVHAALSDALGANPVETIEHATGEWALRFLLLTLAITPLRRLTGWGKLLRYRRMLGLFTFFYASLHFLTWIWLDQQLVWSEILADIAKRPYVTVGFAAWLLLLPLAVTSNRWSMRRLGTRWQMLHRAVYAIGILAVLHYAWLVKADLLEPLVYAAILALLLGNRYLHHLRGKPVQVGAAPRGSTG